LFTHSYFLRFDPKQWETAQPYAPLGTLYAASLMRESGFTVSLFDTMFAENPEEVISYIDKCKPEFFVIYDDGFNYLTKMCLTNMRKAAFRMCRIARQKGCKVIVSSSDSTDHFEKYLEEGADFILIGEGEITLLELIRAISNNENDFSNIQGIAYKYHEAVVKTMRRAVMKNLDEIPFPAWDIIDMKPYQKMWMNSSGYFSMNIATTRGCPFKCNWCAKPIYGNRYNSRSPQNVVDELKLLKEKFQFEHIWFCDDIFGLKPGWINEFAVLVKKENLKFKFRIQARADLLLEDDYIKSLAVAGCENIWMGAESGSQKILDAMDKGTKVEQIYVATKLLKENNIHPSFFIQFGYPGETKEDIEKTIRMINELLPYSIGISVSYPLPGTVFYERVKDQLKEKSNWSDSDELKLMFRNTYSPVFYKQLHRYVHRDYRKHLAFESMRKIFAQPSSMQLKTLKKVISSVYYIPASFFAKQKLMAIENSGT
ncbi:MAG TPA: radical SAM protein, partial [Puia sp.]|nr:radical SAM protein [Puia sp.]